jgi:hypothetical protein
MLATLHVSGLCSAAILRVMDEGSNASFGHGLKKVGLPVLQGIPGIN